MAPNTPTPTSTPRPRQDSTLDEAAHLRGTAAALSTSQETTRAAIPPPREENDINRVVKDLAVKVDSIQNAMVVLMGATAKQLENSSRQEGKQDENTSLTSRSLQWAKVGAALIAGAGVIVPVIIVVYGKWLEQHPSAIGALVLAALTATATALGVGPKLTKSAAPVATEEGRPGGPPPSPT